MGKTRGMGAGRKLKRLRINQRWADKQYKKSHLGNEWKKPSTSCCHAKGIVLEIIGNSAIRVQLKNGKTVTAFVPNNDCLKYIVENDEVLIGGFGFPGVRLKVLTVSGVFTLGPLFKEKK